MDDQLVFSVEEWLGSQCPEEVDRMTAAALRIAIGGDTLTRLEDLAAKTVRQTARVSAYRLACWLAGNWWRLRWEPERPESRPASRPDWEMSHCLPAVGGGYLWPNLRFVSDGDVVQVSSRVTRFTDGLSPVRYLVELERNLPVARFEAALDALVEQVLDRLAELGLAGSDLDELWREVRRERADPALTLLRRREALLGVDPDEADPQLLARLDECARKLGWQAVEEIAGAASHTDVLPALDATLRARSKAGQAPVARSDPAVRADLRRALAQSGMGDRLPWQVGEALAMRMRKAWGLGAGPIDNTRLAGIAGTDPRLFDAPGGPGLPPGLPPVLPRVLDAAAFRDAHQPDHFRVMIRSPYPENRRLHGARLLLDQGIAEDTEQLLPAAIGRTRRMQLQRAFATALLCPYEEWRDRSPAGFDDDDIAGIACDYGVSQLTVRSILVNKGDLDRSRLRAA